MEFNKTISSAAAVFKGKSQYKIVSWMMIIHQPLNNNNNHLWFTFSCEEDGFWNKNAACAFSSISMLYRKGQAAASPHWIREIGRRKGRHTLITNSIWRTHSQTQYYSPVILFYNSCRISWSCRQAGKQREREIFRLRFQEILWFYHEDHMKFNSDPFDFEYFIVIHPSVSVCLSVPLPTVLLRL